jgi:hypothetical protein
VLLMSDGTLGSPPRMSFRRHLDEVERRPNILTRGERVLLAASLVFTDPGSPPEIRIGKCFLVRKGLTARPLAARGGSQWMSC